MKRHQFPRQFPRANFRAKIMKRHQFPRRHQFPLPTPISAPISACDTNFRANFREGTGMSRSGSPPGHGAVIALGALDGGEVDPRQQHDQVRGPDLDLSAALCGGRETEASSSSRLYQIA
jgi:hypothetical protein